MSEEKTIESEQIYKGKIVQLRVDTVSLVDGRTKKVFFGKLISNLVVNTFRNGYKF